LSQKSCINIERQPDVEQLQQSARKSSGGHGYR
jgi:hypothetical protein